MNTTRLMRIEEVLRATGMRRSSLYRAIAAKAFPTPVSLSSRARAWRSEDIDAWISERPLAANDQARS